MGSFRVLPILLLASVTLTFVNGQGGYKYDPKKSRTTPKTAFPMGKLNWDFQGIPPLVPGDEPYFDAVPLQTKPKEACSDYALQTRGVFETAEKKTHYFYPFKTWVKSCDVSRFLWCSNGQCICFPGMYWLPYNKTLGLDGRCVAGFHQDCSRFNAYDFYLLPECGEGMHCVDSAEPAALVGRNVHWDAQTKRCECFPNQAYAHYQGAKEMDDFFQPKYYCAVPKPKLEGEECEEYLSEAWKPKQDPPPKFDRVKVTKTGCGDVKKIGEPNYFCNFPGKLTGPAPVDASGKSIPYGQRKGGTCRCTDKLLGYKLGEGCKPKAGALCDPNSQLVTFTGRLPGLSSNLTTGNTKDCGPDAKCETGIVRGLEKTRCVCKRGIPVDKAGLCSKDFKAGYNADGSKKRVGDKCVHISDPCVNDEGQECILGKCRCKIGYVQYGDVCKGLYGVTCTSSSFCFGEDYVCTNVPELENLNLHFPGGTKYCVCKKEYLYILTGKCTGCGLHPTSIGFLLLAAAFLKIYSN